ncbi:MAG: hypothetical protein JWN93_800 [Hyphomicrobiales bacterium]|jgi:hypothetical protein|nr:hypothetical protein [Hyphomicrobiales bacterium]
MRFNLVLAAAALLLGAATAQAANRKVDIVNETGATMTEFYASVGSTNSWEEDILGDDELEDGDTVEVNVDDGSNKCIYDFRAVFDNGAEAVKRGVNVCQISTFTFTR